jgi:hypothetical protein
MTIPMMQAASQLAMRVAQRISRTDPSISVINTSAAPHRTSARSTASRQPGAPRSTRAKHAIAAGRTRTLNRASIIESVE